MIAERRRCRGGRGNVDYDLELAVMCAITANTGYEWTLDEIADVCGVSRQAIRFLWIEAKKSFWKRAHYDRELIKDLNESRGMDGSNRYFLPDP